MLVDTHAHLDFPEFVDHLGAVFDNAAKKGVTEIITVGIDEKSSQKAVQIAERYESVYAVVGQHPHGAHELCQDELNAFQSLANAPKVVAIGEIGLDYYRDRQPRKIQRRCLRQQLDLAVELKLPVVFHVRDAYEDFMSLLNGYAQSLSGWVMHCFSGSWEFARWCLELGAYISIPGIVTFAKADSLQEVVRKMPLERILLETDCPFLAPVPYRGKLNQPAYLYYTACKIAELRRMALEDLAAATTKNAHAVFRNGK